MKTSLIQLTLSIFLTSIADIVAITWLFSTIVITGPQGQGFSAIAPLTGPAIVLSVLVVLAFFRSNRQLTNRNGESKWSKLNFLSAILGSSCLARACLIAVTPLIGEQIGIDLNMVGLIIGLNCFLSAIFLFARLLIVPTIVSEKHLVIANAWANVGYFAGVLVAVMYFQTIEAHFGEEPITTCVSISLCYLVATLHAYFMKGNSPVALKDEPAKNLPTKPRTAFFLATTMSMASYFPFIQFIAIALDNSLSIQTDSHAALVPLCVGLTVGSPFAAILLKSQKFKLTIFFSFLLLCCPLVCLIPSVVPYTITAAMFLTGIAASVSLTISDWLIQCGFSAYERLIKFAFRMALTNALALSLSSLVSALVRPLSATASLRLVCSMCLAVCFACFGIMAYLHFGGFLSKNERKKERTNAA